MALVRIAIFGRDYRVSAILDGVIIDVKYAHARGLESKIGKRLAASPYAC
jgi:hypothetical protein